MRLHSSIMDNLPLLLMLFNLSIGWACYMDVITDQRTADFPEKAIVLFRCQNESFLDQHGEKYPITNPELRALTKLACWTKQNNITLTLVNSNHEDLTLLAPDLSRLCTLGNKLAQPRTHLTEMDQLYSR